MGGTWQWLIRHKLYFKFNFNNNVSSSHRIFSFKFYILFLYAIHWNWRLLKYNQEIVNQINLISISGGDNDTLKFRNEQRISSPPRLHLHTSGIPKKGSQNEPWYMVPCIFKLIQELFRFGWCVVGCIYWVALLLTWISAICPESA
jgi:hypothetical protein